jgi:hypothetical protein
LNVILENLAKRFPATFLYYRASKRKNPPILESAASQLCLGVQALLTRSGSPVNLHFGDQVRRPLNCLACLANSIHEEIIHLREPFLLSATPLPVQPSLK